MVAAAGLLSSTLDQLVAVPGVVVPAVLAVAQSAKLELRIWKYEGSLNHWRLYVLKWPRGLKEGDTRQTVRLRLEDEHYERLRPHV